jgi:hypothetical protein
MKKEIHTAPAYHLVEAVGEVTWYATEEATNERSATKEVRIVEYK